MEDRKYTIGEVSKICNISTKALRFYDKIGIVPPDEVSKESGYRYYNMQTLLTVPIVKYYKQMGFKLDEMKGLLDADTSVFAEQHFQNKIEELKIEEERIRNSLVSIKDWIELIQESRTVIAADTTDVSAKYFQPTTYCGMDFGFNYNYMESIINIEWTNHLESVNNEITGPVILRFDSFEEKMLGNCRRARIIQKPIHGCRACENQQSYGGFMVASVYHIGKHETIDEEYKKILKWAEQKGYRCGKESFERYVVDHWTMKNSDRFVTEVMVPIYKE